MKLKMQKPFNAKLVRQMLLEEDKFISDIFSKMPLPLNELVAQNGHDEYENEYLEQKKERDTSSEHKSKRAQTFEELHAKLDELKGKKLNHKDRLVKKGLKNRIQKKAKREERFMRKKLARTERAAAEKSTTKEETDSPKTMKQKPIFNSKALAKATGEKVKDDPELLKRTIKREEQKKKHSKKKWEARKEKVQKAVQEKQQKRSENILKRKRDVKTNKMKKAAKKGRIIPGF
ncbi:hypothetical protein QAD02_016563 [Eretmocerus hayati]|uniref:Uncharacterized protein n=1 Tax=Eretmocerus hayati TaxID=131215 RepID=A0ACC2PCS7_9HYME|nr:hypothetical protein QAD02_016563 [Eretmocerus hayati]